MMFRSFAFIINVSENVQQMRDNVQYPKNTITCAILAGGKGSRMESRDKGLVPLAGRPMIEHAIMRIRPQVGAIMINANRHLEEYRNYGYPVVQDSSNDFQGPLAGMAACLRHCHTPWMATIPCDVPLLPEKLIGRLHHALTLHDAEVAVATDGQRLHPVFCLISVELTDKLEAFLMLGGRKIDRWLQQVRTVQADFSDAESCFHNVNTADELAKLNQALLHR